MGNSGSSGEKGRRSIAAAINESHKSGFNEKHMRKIFALYDTDGDGVLGWQEAKRYLSDLLELSGKQAIVIREAREAGETNVAQYYERFLRECFEFLDEHKTGQIRIDELVKPSGSHVTEMLAAVRQLSAVQSTKPKTNLVLSSKMTHEPTIPDDLVINGALCVGGCGFIGNPDTEGYCAGCLQMILGAQTTTTTKTTPTKPTPTAPPSDDPKPPMPNTKPPKRNSGKAAPLVPNKDKEEVSDNDDSDNPTEEDFLETSTRERHMKFAVINGTEVEKLMQRRIKETSELLGLSHDAAALVLMYFDWNSQKLQERYFSDVDKYRKLCGIATGDNSQPQEAQDGDCAICFEEVRTADTASLQCGHGPYCRGCYAEYLHEKVSSGGASTILATTCMSKDCPLRLSPLQWKRLAQPDDLKRYDYFYLKHYVEHTRNLGFCPNPNCTFVVKFNGLGRPVDVVECMCGKKYCFACCAEAHNPISCEQLQGWLNKTSDDTESIKYIQATSKQCPHCHMATERNEGCNHMTCRRDVGGCGGEWCWMCRGDWKTHGSKTGGYFSCNLYDKSAAKKIDDQAQSLVEEAQYFSHFHDRFVNHGQLERDAESKRADCVSKWMVSYRALMDGLDPTFMLSGIDLLVKCRHTLKMTYVYAWFMDSTIKEKEKEKPEKVKRPLVRGKKGDAQTTGPKSLAMMKTQQELFNFQQANLEGITERLGEIIFSWPRLESSNTPVKLKEYTEELKNLINVTQRFLANLISGFESIQEEEEWE